MCLAVAVIVGLGGSGVVGGLGGCAASRPRTEVGPQAATYISVADVPYRSFIPPPTATQSAVTRGEIELLLAIQADASPAARDRANDEEKLTVWKFASVMGPQWRKDRLPITDEVMAAVIKDAKTITDTAKAEFARTRPPSTDPRVKPWVEVPESESYPSGHSTRAMTWAVILGELEPEKREALRRRAGLVGLDRIAGGVHFPTDVAAGFALGDAIATKVLTNPKFRADLARVRTEWEAAKAGKP